MTKRKVMPKQGTKSFDILISKMTPAEIREIMPDILHNSGLPSKRKYPHLHAGDLEDRIIPVPERLHEAGGEDDD